MPLQPSTYNAPGLAKITAGDHSPQESLAGLSPLEALVGLTPREVAPEAQEFLGAGAAERLEVVVQAAQSYASSLEA